MKIALAQSRIVWEDKLQNMENAQKVIACQVARGAELVLFPEMSFTGFSMNTSVTGEDGQDTVDRLSTLAAKHGVNVGFGWVRRAGDKCENCYTIVDKSGGIISEYVKIHPFSYSGEDKTFRGGKNVVLYEIDGIRFTTFICYDLRFPELFRAVCEDTAAVIIPANWPAKRSEHWKILLRARAIENQVYILAVNCQGNMGGQYYSGDSCVINPDGKIQKMLSDREGVLFLEFENNVDTYRKVFPVWKDCKRTLYAGL